MLEMTKVVLRKVSFDRGLFKKELIKALRWLKKDEIMVLKTWCLVTFAGKYDEIIMEVFETIT